MENHIQTIDSG